MCAPEAANPAGTAAGAADVAPATGPAATGEAVPDTGGGLTGGTAPAALELAAILRVNDADGSTPAPGRFGTPDPGPPDNPDGVVAPGNPPAPDDNPDNGLPPPKPPADNPPPPGTPPPLNGDGSGVRCAGVAGIPVAIGPPGNSPRSCGSPCGEPPTAAGPSVTSEMSPRTCGSPCPLLEPPGASSPAFCKPVCPELPDFSPRCCGSLLSARVVRSFSVGARSLIPAASRPTSFRLERGHRPRRR